MAHVDEQTTKLVAEDGYRVISRDERVVVLERNNSWLAVAITAVLAGVGGGCTAVQRTDRVYLDVDERGEAVVQLSPPHRQAEQK